jgi:hypothetical protein
MNWIKAHKIWTLLIIVGLLIVIGAAGGGSKKNTNQPKQKQAVKSAPVKQNTSNTSKPAVKTVSYQAVVNKETGSQITIVGVIDPSLNNSENLPTLCNQFHSSAASSPSKFFFADVYDSPSAAANRDKVLNDTASASETSDYDLHYVLTYKHNPTTNFNQCTITYQGDNDPNPVIIKY